MNVSSPAKRTAGASIRTPRVTAHGAVGEKMPLIDGALVTKRDKGGKIQIVLVMGDEVVLECLEVANGKMHNIMISAKDVTVRNCHVRHASNGCVRERPCPERPARCPKAPAGRSEDR